MCEQCDSTKALWRLCHRCSKLDGPAPRDKRPYYCHQCAPYSEWNQKHPVQAEPRSLNTLKTPNYPILMRPKNMEHSDKDRTV